MWRRVGREEPQRVHGGWDVSDEITNATLAAALQRGAGPGFRWLTADEVGNVIQEAEGLKADSFVKVIAPSAYAWLFAFGSSRGAISLPFYVTALLLLCSAAVAASIPAAMWQSPSPSARGGPASPPPPPSPPKASVAPAKAQ